jgi:hypothetical protein
MCSGELNSLIAGDDLWGYVSNLCLQDLVAWLEKRELTTRPVHAQPTATSPAETYPEGNASRHQEAAEVALPCPILKLFRFLHLFMR